MDIRPVNLNVQVDAYTSKTSTNTVVPEVVNTQPVAVVQSNASIEPKPTETSLEALAEAVKQINEAVKQKNVGLQFSIDEDTNETVVKVIDTQTNDLIRQIPSVEALEIAKALDKLEGMLFQKKA
ncbi:MAG: flagellar protein FlaG [Pseudomonadota bacterium]